MSLAPDHTDAAVTDPSNSIASVIEADNKGSIRSEFHKNFSFASAAWLFVLATPLLFFPRVLSLIFGSLLTESGSPEGEGAAEVIRQLNVLERSLAGLTGFALAALGSILVIQTGAVPLTSSIASTGTASPDAPFRTPTVIVTTAFFTALAWYSYELGMWLVTGVSGILTVWGFWTITFGNDSIVNKAHEKRGGNVSSFPFKNEHAEVKKSQ